MVTVMRLFFGRLWSFTFWLRLFTMDTSFLTPHPIKGWLGHYSSSKSPSFYSPPPSRNDQHFLTIPPPTLYPVTWPCRVPQSSSEADMSVTLSPHSHLRHHLLYRLFLFILLSTVFISLPSNQRCAPLFCFFVFFYFAIFLSRFRVQNR